jgi:CRP-like cAMP-binding protein
MDAREAVSHMPLFRGADPADLDAIAAIAERRAYTAGEHVFQRLHPADALFYIEMGNVEVTAKDKELPVATLGSGQSLGDLAFFCRDTHGGSAYARETTHVLRVPFSAIDRLIAERPSFALVFYRNAAQRFAYHALQMAGERDRPYL